MGMQQEGGWMCGWKGGQQSLECWILWQDIGHANDDQFCVFTMDNLNSHRNVAVVALIHLIRKCF